MKNKRLISSAPPALSLPSWQSYLPAWNRTWHVVIFPPLSLSCPSGNLNRNDLFQGNNFFLLMALLSAFLLFILLSLLPFLLLFGNSISYLKVENSSEKISKKKYQKNNSNLHSAVCHLSQLKLKKKKNSFKNNNKKPKNQKNFSVFLISHISLANNY